MEWSGRRWDVEDGETAEERRRLVELASVRVRFIALRGFKNKIYIAKRRRLLLKIARVGRLITRLRVQYRRDTHTHAHTYTGHI